MRYHVFCDFDGTITANDVGYEFFKLFANGKAEPIVQKYRAGKASAIECLQTECDIYNENPIELEHVYDFVDKQPITPGIKEFVKFCYSNSIKLTILSAGFDFYIKRILVRLNLNDLELYATPTRIENNKLYPEFVRYDEAVCPRCVDCKGARIRELASGGETSIFIGDGHSDSHGAEQTDIVYAKSFLAEHLDEKRIKYFPFTDFYDIIESFQKELDLDNNTC